MWIKRWSRVSLWRQLQIMRATERKIELDNRLARELTSAWETKRELVQEPCHA